MSTTIQRILTFSVIITLILIAGCDKAEPSDNDPEINSITVNPPSVNINGIAIVTVDADDEEDDDDDLTYTYAPSNGAISGNTATVSWTAPSMAGTYSVIVTVEDTDENKATGSASLTVTAPPTVTQINGVAHFEAGVNGDLNNAKVSLYTSLDNWFANNPIKYGAVSGSGASASFTIPTVNPGNYYLDIWKDNDNDGVWATSGDYIGWYGTGGLGNYFLSEFQIAEGQTINLDITMFIVP